MATKRTVDQGRHRRRDLLPWWGHVIVAGLMLAGIAASGLVANPLCGLFAVIAAWLAYDAINKQRTPAERLTAAIASAVLALAAVMITVDGLGGDPTLVLIIAGCAGAVALVAWRVQRATRQLDRIVEEVAPR